ncbi:histidine kinase [Actinoplanes sp. KI2]|uniref:sensor histidine kinase n=1 Tax=Actinoplanes sp. KI2 TaxID=2983315 RepID=UPI0021D58845|nr:histidine kinase [Actinoplanes sp. KI2]MCU7726847.1 histidine kinase [Actinoplanes sp. KI2]
MNADPPPRSRWRRFRAPVLRRDGPQPRMTPRNWAFDVLLVAVFIVVVLSGTDIAGHLFETTSDGTTVMHIPDIPGAPVVPVLPPEPWPVNPQGPGWIAVAAILPLLMRRRYPLGTLMVILGITVLSLHGESPGTDILRVSFYACVIAGYTAAAYSPYRVPALAALPLAALLYSSFHDLAVPIVPVGTVPFLVLLPIGLAVNGMRTWRQHADRLRRERADALREATRQERARIARDLHDIVTHNVSMMVIQAGAARKVLDTAPEASREALLAVEEGGRAALGELRGVMGLLAAADDDEQTLTPQPGLAQLPPLIDRVRDAGIDVTVTTSGDRHPLPAGVELAAYRVVQEALTNTVKHASGARATVDVTYAPDELRITVTDTGGRPTPESAGSTGRGLAGLRERLAVYGGTLQAAARLTGGYRVQAQLPLESR